MDSKKKEFEDIALEYMELLYRSALRMTKNTQEAEDLIQDTYMQAYRHFDKFEKGTNFKAWIFKILTNTFINKYRKKKRTPQHLDIDQVSFQIIDQDTQEGQEMRNKINGVTYEELFDDDIIRALDKLSEEFRQIVLLSELEGLTYKEIAKKTDIPLGTVMSRLFRGRRVLQRSLQGYARRRGYLSEPVLT